MKIILAGLTLLTALPSLAATPASYPLKCRGTKSTELLYEFAPTVANLSFKKAARAASGGLDPGECAFLDRALSADEPSKLEIHPVAPKNMYGTTSIRFGYAPSPGQPVQVVAPLIGGNDPELGWMKDLLTPENYWVFKVYNDRLGHFIVTNSQPGTP